MNNNWDETKISNFLNGVKNGTIIPKSSGHGEYKGKPMTSFSFPEYSCEIHVHWEDVNCEIPSVAHIKDLTTDDPFNQYPSKIVDTHTISMLRHFSGLDDKKNVVIENRIDLLSKDFEDALLDIGLSQYDATNDIFFKAYVEKRGIKINIAFLFCEFSKDNSNIDQIIARGRNWCDANINSGRKLKETSLNILVFHKGEITKNDISGKVDKSGLHRSILQSIFAVNLTNGGFIKKTSVFALGKEKKVMKRVEMVGNIASYQVPVRQYRIL